MRSTWRELFLICGVALALSACSGSGDSSNSAPAPVTFDEPLENSPPPADGPAENDAPASDPPSAPLPPNDAPGGVPPSNPPPSNPPPSDPPPANDQPSVGLSLIDSLPRSLSEDVSLQTSIGLSFSVPIDPLSITKQTVRLTSAAGAEPGALTVASRDLTFVPSNPLRLATEYDVAVSGLRALNGTSMATAHVAFTTRDGDWLPAQVLSNTNAAAYAARLATGSTGNGMAVWFQLDGANRRIMAMRRDSQGWTAIAEPISDLPPSGAYTLDLAINDAGDALVVWEPHEAVPQSDTPLTAVWANYYAADVGEWRGAQRIADPCCKNSVNADAVVDDDGNAIVVWSTSPDHEVGGRIVSRRYDAQQESWSEPEYVDNEIKVGNGVARGSYAAQLAIGSSGQVMAIWTQDVWPREQAFLPISRIVRSNVFDRAQQKWGATPLTVGGESNWAAHPRIAIDAKGNAVAVWTQDFKFTCCVPAGRIEASHFVAGKGPGAGWGPISKFLHNGELGTDPEVAVDPRGNALVVWHTVFPAWPFGVLHPKEAFAIRYDAAAAQWDPQETMISRPDLFLAAYTLEKRVAFDSAGNAIAVFEQRNDDTQATAIAARRYLGGTRNRWNDLVILSASKSSTPNIAIDARGRASAVWTVHSSPGSSQGNIVSRTFE